MTTLTEGDVENAALEWLGDVGWQTAHGPDIAPGAAGEERADYGAVVLERRLRDALAWPSRGSTRTLPLEALDDAFHKLTSPEGSTLESRNRAFHRMLVAGVNVEYRTAGGAIRGDQAAMIDCTNPAANDFLAVNQVTVTERDQHPPPERRALRQRPAAIPRTDLAHVLQTATVAKFGAGEGIRTLGPSAWEASAVGSQTADRRIGRARQRGNCSAASGPTQAGWGG